MPTSKYAKIVTAGLGDADLVPDALKAIADQIDSRIVLRATSAANRNALYGDAPDGTPVICTTDGTLWAKAGGAWVTLWAPAEDWVKCGSDAVFNPVYVRRYLVGGKLRGAMRGQLSRVDGTPIGASNLDGSRTFVTLPPGYAPAAAYGSFTQPITCSLQDASFVPVSRALISAGDGAITVYSQQKGPADADQVYLPVQWVNFDGVEFWIDF